MFSWLRRSRGAPSQVTAASPAPASAQPAPEGSREHVDPLEGLGRSYSLGSTDERLAAVHALAGLAGQASADLLVKAFPRDASPALGVAVTVALRRRGDPRARNVLAKTLNRISAGCYDAHGRLRDVDITPTIVNVAEGLAELGEDAIGLLVDCLDKPASESHPLRDRVARVLKSMSREWQDAAVRLLVRIIDDPKTKHFQLTGAFELMMELGGPPSERAVELLLLAAVSTGAFHREALDLADREWTESPAARASVPRLVDTLTMGRISWKGGVIEILRAIGDAGAFEPLLGQLDGDCAEPSLRALEQILTSNGASVPPALLIRVTNLQRVVTIDYRHCESNDRASAWLERVERKLDLTHVKMLAREELKRRQLR